MMPFPVTPWTGTPYYSLPSSQSTAEEASFRSPDFLQREGYDDDIPPLSADDVRPESTSFATAQRQHHQRQSSRSTGKGTSTTFPPTPASPEMRFTMPGIRCNDSEPELPMPTPPPPEYVRSDEPEQEDDKDAISRHPVYYYECGDICFQVQNTLFRLHSFILQRESTGAILPPPSRRSSDPSDNPVSLNVRVQDFESFVRILYHPVYRPLKVTTEDWISALSLSTRWNFPALREEAIRRLSSESLPPVRQICLAQSYSIPDWLLPAYIALCEREEPLSFLEGGLVGMKVVTLLAQARERMKKEKTIFKKLDVAKIVSEVNERLATEG